MEENISNEEQNEQSCKTDVSTRFTELYDLCDSKNLHCCVAKQRITEYSVEIYTGYSKSYIGYYYSDSHTDLNEAIEKAFEWLNTESKESYPFDPSKMYTQKEMIESAKYGYEYHSTTSFPDKSFEDNCKNNFLQHLSSK